MALNLNDDGKLIAEIVGSYLKEYAINDYESEKVSQYAVEILDKTMKNGNYSVNNIRQLAGDIYCFYKAGIPSYKFRRR
jgi:hypothetical protein